MTQEKNTSVIYRTSTRNLIGIRYQFDHSNSIFYISTMSQFTETSQELPPMHRTILICDYIKSLKMRPKTYLQNFLVSEDDEIIKQCQYWGTSTGWESTEKIMLSIKKLVLESSDRTGEDRWEQFILREVNVLPGYQNLCLTDTSCSRFRQKKLLLMRRCQEDMLQKDHSTVHSKLLKLSSTPNLKPSELRLRSQACRSYIT